jgi:Nucleotidyl transferase AbiEii toxin, Type IV TA system
MASETVRLSEELVRGAEILASIFAKRSIPYALIGGLATSMRGRPRFTRDIDFVIEIPQLVLPGLLDELLQNGFTLDRMKIIREFVQQHITAFQYGAVRIDWLKPVLPVYKLAISSATELTWSEHATLRVASAESLILMKMVAFRPQDQLDVVTLLSANRETINVDVVRSEWRPFADGEAERTKWLEAQIATIVTRTG